MIIPNSLTCRLVTIADASVCLALSIVADSGFLLLGLQDSFGLPGSPALDLPIFPLDCPVSIPGIAGIYLLDRDFHSVP
jgi:hypothetical protein